MNDWLVQNAWAIFTFFGLIAIWGLRLEGKVNQVEKDHESNREMIKLTNQRIDQSDAKREALESKVLEQLSDVKASLARIEGQLIK